MRGFGPRFLSRLRIVGLKIVSAFFFRPLAVDDGFGVCVFYKNGDLQCVTWKCP